MKSQLTDRQFARIGWVLVWDALANSKMVFARSHSIQLHRAFGFFGNEFDNQRSQPPKRAKKALPNKQTGEAPEEAGQEKAIYEEGLVANEASPASGRLGDVVRNGCPVQNDEPLERLPEHRALIYLF